MLKDNVIDLATKSTRLFLAGPSTPFRLHRPGVFRIPKIKKSGIYIHVPFCKQLCPYCPYNRILYNKELAEGFITAVIKEIGCSARQLPDLEVPSVYFGGGTPTLLSDKLKKIIEALHSNFRIEGPLCIETHPADLTWDKVQSLKSMDFNSISLGVQSFQKKWLDLIGRHYSPEKIKEVLNWLERADFTTINIDLLFALPGETLKDLEADLEKATSTSVDQITFYPLFTFPYSSIGEYRKLRNVEMPNLSLRKKMYYFLYDYLIHKGYHRVSVWSFKKKAETPRFSSVTREHYVGFGPSACSYYGSLFTLNTFSVPEYIKSVEGKGHAVALEIPFTQRLSILYDFYWRLYDTYIPEKRESDQLNYSLKDFKPIHLLVKLSELFGMLRKDGDYFSLTREGSFWIHLIQNYFSLRYINTIWSEAKREAWPEAINF
jgi:oxygen-independent coproporphyrinogen-3 oxidase